MAANANESVLGKQSVALRSTPSTRYENNSENINVNVEITVAPVAPEDVPNLLEILLQCPTGQYALRVFQQHAEGLCWQDSFFIMLYNQDWFKPFLSESIEFYMQQFFGLGYTDLAYPVEQEVEVINWNQYNSRKPYDEQIKRKNIQKFKQIKIASIAKFFKEKFGFGLPLAFWEYYCLQLHRYILLGYLFLKYPDASANTARASKPTNLYRRRKSIGHSNYSKLALNYKEYVFNMFDIGMYCYNFQKARQWFITFVSAVSNNTIGFRTFDDKSVSISDVLAYYLGIQSKDTQYKHMISLFKCQETWFLYDIDVGTIQFTPEETTKLNASRIVSLVFENKKAANVFEYTLILQDGSSIVRTLPLKQTRDLKYEVIQLDFSMLLVRLSDRAAAAPALEAPLLAAPLQKSKSNNSLANSGGSLRKTRKRRQSRKESTR